jgi:chromosome segregation ATPase
MGILGQLTTMAIDGRIADLQQKQAKKNQEQSAIRQHLGKLGPELESAELEAVLEDSPTARKRAEDLKVRIPALKAKDSDFTRDLQVIEAALSELRNRRAAAEGREIEAKFDARCKALSSLGKDIEPLFAALAKKIAQGVALASECQSVSLPHTHGSHAQTAQCNDAFRDAVLAALIASLEESVPYIRALGLERAKQAVLASGVGAYLDSRLEAEIRRLHFALTGTPNQAPETPEDLPESDDAEDSGSV